MTKWNLSQVCKPGSTFKDNVIHHINKLKKKNHMIISTVGREIFNEIQYPFMIKTLSKLGIEKNFFNLINIYKKPTVTIILNGEKLQGFSLM